MAMKSAYLELNKAIGLIRNPKDHDIGEIDTSMKRFGFLERIIINETTGRLIAGHGRIETLRKSKVKGATPPINIKVDGDNWLVPCDYVQIPESEEEAAAIALNRLVERGGWNENMLTNVLSDLAAMGEDMLDGIGFDTDDIDKMLGNDSDYQDEQTGESVDIPEQWAVIVECEDELQQTDLIDYLLEQGYKVRALIG